jgi:hypothetical protein
MHNYRGNGTGESGNAESKKSFIGGTLGANSAGTARQIETFKKCVPGSFYLLGQIVLEQSARWRL